MVLENESIFTRQRLYDLVWSKPMVKIAKDYGMSDNSIRKICRKFNIPTPEAGHWQKVQHGKPVKQKVSCFNLPSIIMFNNPSKPFFAFNFAVFYNIKIKW